MARTVITLFTCIIRISCFEVYVCSVYVCIYVNMCIFVVCLYVCKYVYKKTKHAYIDLPHSNDFIDTITSTQALSLELIRVFIFGFYQ